jgi:hypothetical protein
MKIALPPHGLTVLQTLFDRERAKVFNQHAANDFPTVREDFGNAIQDFVIARSGKTPARTTRKMAENAWKWDHAADRRFRNAAPEDDLSSMYKGRPEAYDPDVVMAFANAIAQAAGRTRFSIGHHGDLTITDQNEAGPMVRVLVDAIQWAMAVAWQMSAPWGTPPPPRVRPEGIIALIKRSR